MIVGNKYTIKVRISRENNITKLVVGDRNIPISSDDNTTVNIESITYHLLCLLSIYKQG
jgi:hypothetical protein